MLFEFDRFFKDQNFVKSRIHFNDKRGLYLGGGGGGGGGFLTQGGFLFAGGGGGGGGGVVVL